MLKSQNGVTSRASDEANKMQKNCAWDKQSKQFEMLNVKCHHFSLFSSDTHWYTWPGGWRIVDWLKSIEAEQTIGHKGIPVWTNSRSKGCWHSLSSELIGVFIVRVREVISMCGVNNDISQKLRLIRWQPFQLVPRNPSRTTTKTKFVPIPHCLCKKF